MSEPQQPVFYDSSRKRQIFFSFFLYFVCVIAFIATCGFIVTIIETPILSSSSTEFHGRRENPSTIARSVNEWQDARIIDIPRARVAYYSHARARLRYVLRRDRALSDVKKRLAAEMKLDDASKLSQPRHILQSGSNPQITLAFYVEDEPSLDSLKQHCQQITHFAPAWLTLAPDGCTVINSEERYPASIDQQAEYFARKDDMIIMPVLQNFSKGILQTQVLHEMLASPTKQSRVISQLIATITAKKFQGINVDLESFSPDDRPLMTQFMTRLASEFHQRHLLVSQDVVVSSKAYDLAGLAAVNDFIVPMIYDEHSSGRLGAGPIASNNWFRTELANYMAAVPASKTVIGLAGYSYDWVIGSNSSNFMTFGAAASKAQSAMDGSDGIIQTDKRSGNPYFTYYDDSSGTGTSPAHIVWMQDAVTAYNQLLMASSYHPLGAALWRLGDEDPSIWDFLGKVPLSSLRSLDSNSLSKIDYGYFGIQPVGNGDILTVVGTPKIGQRRLTIDPNSGMITSELFTTYPSQYVVQRTGILDNNGVNKQKIVALTFDDGPDPRWTPQILNILNQFHVPATFFVVGENAEANPGIVQREWDEGMEIGNHSFTHPEMDLITHARIRLELDATQRVIEAITGHESKLFRAPNRADSDPASAADLAPVIDGDNLGYIFVGEQIDPNDWRPGITAAEIVSGPAGVVTTASTGNCILLHDAGGETREETVKALPPIIEKLKAEGYKFVLVSDLTGKSKAELFPEVTGSQRLYVMWDRFAFDASYWVSRILTFIFVLTIVLGIGRIVIFTTLALIQYKRELAPIRNPSYQPSVSVIIAAYNESKVINRTITALLNSDYPNLEIVVVDDGSTDRTADVVRSAFPHFDSVRVIEKLNGGKASALNLGIRECNGEILVALDADTLFNSSTIGNLVRHFEDPGIGAVSGNVKVGNRHNAWTWWQALEYITSQNFDRRAFGLLNCISVVPGAVGAWRKDAIILAGLYSSQTLAEDTDLTFKIRQLGYRIITDNAALAYTEAPDTLKDLSKQRFRWAYGTLQCLWKHRSAMFNLRFGAFGFFALPSLWLYQIIFQALAPLVDAAIVWTVFYGSVFAPQFEYASTILLLKYWLLFTIFEVSSAYIALTLDKEDRKLLVWLPLQRFVYRQMMYYVILKSIVTAIKGNRVGWGKLDRTGTVSAPEELGSSGSEPRKDLLETR